MTPIPSPTARASFVFVVITVAAGAASRSSLLVTLGGAGLVGMATALLLSRHLARRARRERLEFAWWIAHEAGSAALGAVTPGAPFSIRCSIRNRGRRALRLRGVRPILTDAQWLQDDLVIGASPGSRSEFTLRAVAPAIGRAVLHGLAIEIEGPLGLFSVPLYFPTHLVVKVLPSVASQSRLVFPPRAGVSVDRANVRSMRREGDGAELRELRDLQPGDAFKRIAWRPSARRGKLLVRETESEIEETRALIVDVSGTMRGGEVGERKLDAALDIAARSAKAALDGGHRVGLRCIDARAVSAVAPRDGARHLLRIYDALLASTEVVDVDLTELDTQDLAALVAAYVRRQEGLDFSRADGSLDVSRLAEHALRTLDASARRATVLGENVEYVTLRRYCLSRGIRLPYRPEPREGGKEQAMLSALRDAGATTRTPRTIELISDFDGVHDLVTVARSIAFLGARGHTVIVWLMRSHTKDAPKGAVLDAQLRLIYGRAEEQRLVDVEKTLRRAGASVVRDGHAPALGAPANARSSRAA